VWICYLVFLLIFCVLESLKWKTESSNPERFSFGHPAWQAVTRDKYIEYVLVTGMFVFILLQLQDKSIDTSPGSFFQLLPRPPSPAMFHYSQPPAGCGAEFNPQPASQPMQISTGYYNSPTQPPSSPGHYGSPVICHVPPELSLQFNVGSSAMSPQHSKIPDIVLTGNYTLDNRHLGPYAKHCRKLVWK